MAIPSEKDILVPLLHLIDAFGGQIKPSDAYKVLAVFFGLTEEDRGQLQPSNVIRTFDNRVAWARFILCSQGLLDGTTRGIWKITEKGKAELARLGLIGKLFPRTASLHDKQSSIANNDTVETKTLDDQIINFVLGNIAPSGPRKFPEDFINDKSCTDYYDVKLPGTQLRLAPLSQTTITSQRCYFRYEAKNPAEAKYILYAYNMGSKNVRVPKDPLTMFKTVKAYERYCEELMNRTFELVLDYTHDEDEAERFTREIAVRLGLKAKLLAH